MDPKSLQNLSRIRFFDRLRFRVIFWNVKLKFLLVFDATSSPETLHFHCKIHGFLMFFTIAKHRFAIDFTLLFHLPSDQTNDKNEQYVIRKWIKKQLQKGDRFWVDFGSQNGSKIDPKNDSKIDSEGWGTLTERAKVPHPSEPGSFFADPADPGSFWGHFLGGFRDPPPPPRDL